MAPRGVVLYRSILRAHKKYLPSEMKKMGDMYVRAEFRAHKEAKPEHVKLFFQEWDKYLDQLHVTARARESLASGTLDGGGGGGGGPSGNLFAFGSDLSSDVELSDEQIQQLKKLKEETDKLRKS